MDVEFVKPLMDEYASMIPLVRRVDAKPVSYSDRDVIEAFRVFDVMMTAARIARDEGEL